MRYLQMMREEELRLTGWAVARMRVNGNSKGTDRQDV
jgi:hypothetical protein